MRFYCDAAGVAFGKFVIPNPFGPFEEPRFTAYLLRQWQGGERRRSAHALLCARQHPCRPPGRSLRRLCRKSGGQAGFQPNQSERICRDPGAFAKRFASEIGPRTGLDCRVVLAQQTEFSEPLVRINTDRPDLPGWSEPAAWDAIANYYAAVSAR